MVVHRLIVTLGIGRSRGRVGAGRGKQVQVVQDLVDHHRVPDEGDNLHLPSTFGTLQWIDLIDSLDERGPALVGFRGRVT